MTLIGHFRVAFCLCFKTSPSAKPFIRNEFDLHSNGLVNETHFHMKGFALGLRGKKQLGNGLFAKTKQTTAINIDFFEDAWKQLEKFSLNFSCCDPFPSWPSAAKDTC